MKNIYNEYDKGIVVDVYQFEIRESWRFLIQIRRGTAQGGGLIHEALLEEETNKAKAIRRGIALFDEAISTLVF